MINMEIELSSSHSVKHVHLKVDSTLTIQFFLHGYFFFFIAHGTYAYFSFITHETCCILPNSVEISNLSHGKTTLFKGIIHLMKLRNCSKKMGHGIKKSLVLQFSLIEAFLLYI